MQNNNSGKFLTIPNCLTLLRMGLIPVLVLVYYLPFAWSHVCSALVFSVAALTDWFDGYLARKLDQNTRFGAFLDPVADKLMVSTALVLLVESHGSILLAVPAMIIIGREIVISALREWMAEMGKRGIVAVSMLGKVKTSFQMIALVILLANAPVTSQWVTVGFALLYLAAIMTIWSMFSYLRAAWRALVSH